MSKRLFTCILIFCLLFCGASAFTQAVGAETTETEDETVTAAAKAPAAAVLGKISSSAYNKITLTWKKVSGATGYFIYRWNGSNHWVRIANVTSQSTTSYTHTSSTKNPIVVGQSYTYTVTAYKKVGTTYYMAGYDKKGLTCSTIPNTVTLVSAAQVNYNKVKLTWKKAGGATHYIIYRRNEAGSWSKIKTVSGASTTSVTLSSTTAFPNEFGKTYTYTVTSYSSINKTRGSYNAAGIKVTMTGSEVKYISHYNGEPNTAYYEAAGSAGFWGIETDLQMTSDGYLICAHDAIGSVTYASVKSKYPTFVTYLKYCKKYGCTPVIDIKDGSQACLKKLYTTVKSYGLLSTAIFQTDDVDALIYLRTLSSSIHLWGLSQGSANVAAQVAAAQTYKYDGINIYLSALTQTIVDQLHKAGVEVCVYTYTYFSTESQNSYKAMGVDYIMESKIS